MLLCTTSGQFTVSNSCGQITYQQQPAAPQHQGRAADDRARLDGRRGGERQRPGPRALPQDARRYHLPDPATTKGVIAHTDKATICNTVWGADARHVSDKTKRKVYVLYRAVKRHKVCCEVDHMVSRDVGGADDRPATPRPTRAVSRQTCLIRSHS